MRKFKHVNAASLDHALSLLDEFQDRAQLIAGGTDLLGVLKGEVLPEPPEVVINLKTIPGLDALEEQEGGIRIGALTRLAPIAQSPMILEHYRLLAQAAKLVASPEIRNMGTLGGNLCQDTRCWYYRYPHRMGGRIQCLRKGKGPCLALKGDNRYHAVFGAKKCFAVCPSDMAVALAALDARLRITGVKGTREIPVSEFYHPLGLFLEPGEILTDIHVPRPRKNSKQTFLKFRLRDSIDFAVVSAASVVTESKGVCRDARIYLGAVAPAPHRAFGAENAVKGKNLDKGTIEQAARASVDGAKPLSKNAYKVEIVKALVRRSLK
ncbi:MAG: FAD binding domain-containing protein [Desulfobacteraceae bacterium]